MKREGRELVAMLFDDYAMVYFSQEMVGESTDMVIKLDKNGYSLFLVTTLIFRKLPFCNRENLEISFWRSHRLS